MRRKVIKRIKPTNTKHSVSSGLAEEISQRVDDALACMPRAEPYDLKTQNIVGTSVTNKDACLRFVQVATQGRYDPKVFPSSVSRSINRDTGERTTNSLFASGRLLTTGASTVSGTIESAKEFIYKNNRVYGAGLDLLNFEVQNVVSSFSLGYPLDVKRFSVDHKVTEKSTSHFESEVFRGCSWRCYTGMVFVLFSSGRGVLTGARTEADARGAYEDAKELFIKYVAK